MAKYKSKLRSLRLWRCRARRRGQGAPPSPLLVVLGGPGRATDVHLGDTGDDGQDDDHHHDVVAQE